MEKKIWKIKWFLKNFWEDQRGMGRGSDSDYCGSYWVSHYFQDENYGSGKQYF